MKKPTLTLTKPSKEKEQAQNLLEQFSFEDTINFLQEKLRQSFIDLEHKRQGEEKKEFLIKKMKQEIEVVKKENDYLRNRNFVISKQY
jgi:hypothetical protein